ncbi:DUF389 domain-containing protein [Fictibacillus gelatini]|uniref:DUF389 domain-containing protein n=1 Tax=Fictibacillus gelatini TaxID=225985 RepID=UPI000420B68E|nr:DUF389 domain-containing protein [Fictibacillus gelatini]
MNEGKYGLASLFALIGGSISILKSIALLILGIFSSYGVLYIISVDEFFWTISVVFPLLFGIVGIIFGLVIKRKASIGKGIALLLIGVFAFVFSGFITGALYIAASILTMQKKVKRA